MKILTPAYGRDYNTAAEVIKGYEEGHEFVLHDPASPWNGAYCSCRNFVDETVELRFNAMVYFVLHTKRSR